VTRCDVTYRDTAHHMTKHAWWRWLPDLIFIDLSPYDLFKSFCRSLSSGPQLQHRPLLRYHMTLLTPARTLSIPKLEAVCPFSCIPLQLYGNFSSTVSPFSEVVDLTRICHNRSHCACFQRKSARDKCFLKFDGPRSTKKMQSARARAFGVHMESGFQDLDSRSYLGPPPHNVRIQCVYRTPIYIYSPSL